MEYDRLKTIADAALEKKAQDVISLDVRSVGSSIADWFVICNADSTTAVAAITDNILVKMKEKCGEDVLRMQGLENDFWIILDFADIVVHIFLTEYRRFYRLEDLWADAPKTEWKDEPAQEEAPSEKRIKPKSVSKVRASVRRKPSRPKGNDNE